MDEHVYMHALGNNSILSDQMITFSSVFNSGAVLSLNKQGIYKPNGYNGSDYISLCDYEKRNKSPKNTQYNSYYLFIRQSISLAFPKDKIEVVTPKYISQYDKDYYDILDNMDKDNDRYSDLLDEVQVKDSIDISLLSYVTFPLDFYLDQARFTKEFKYYLVNNYIKQMKSIMTYYNNLVDIFDIDSKEIIDDKLVKKYIYKR